ncbi:hypothetical protein OAX09_01935 [Gammaproteobacteria bacterium]|nr:hypothetical protein [Gammaproteobacteria bacterium]
MRNLKLTPLRGSLLALSLCGLSSVAQGIAEFDGTTLTISNLGVSQDAYSVDLSLIDKVNMDFQLDQLTIVNITSTVTEDATVDAVFNGSSIVVPRLMVDDVAYSLQLDLVDSATYTFRVNADSIKLVKKDGISDFFGTTIPSFLEEPAVEFKTFNPTVQMLGQLEGLAHHPTDEPGAGKLIFNRVYRAFKYGLEYGQQFGVFGSWLSSTGNNSIEGGLWVNPKTAGPHYYPTLHLAGVGDTYHECNDVQMGSGLYERFIGDRWLTMTQISNAILSVPGVNIAFDKNQAPFTKDNGIWVGSGWTYLDLNHPRDFKFWMSFIETSSYQGPVNGYMPEHWNWVDPEKVSNGNYAENKARYGDRFGTFATKGSSQNWGNGNERIGLSALKLSEDTYFVPAAKLPNSKDREYLIAHPQSISQSDIESYSLSLIGGKSSGTVIPATEKDFFRVNESTHNQLRIKEQINGEDHYWHIEPNYEIGYEGALGYVEWDNSTPELRIFNESQNGYIYVRKLNDKWVVEDDASDEYKNRPNLYQTELIDAPDDFVRVPRVDHRFFSYRERDTTNPDFKNWDVTGKKRYAVKLQNGSTATYVWFRFIDQPALKTARQNHPETYTDAYLELLQSHIEKIHMKINENSRVDPKNPVFINYRKSSNPDNKDPHLAKVDSGQLVVSPAGYEVGYVPVVISVYYAEEYSSNGNGLAMQPHEECTNEQWSDNYYPDID